MTFQFNPGSKVKRKPARYCACGRRMFHAGTKSPERCILCYRAERSPVGGVIPKDLARIQHRYKGNQAAMARHYGVKGNSTISRWLTKMSLPSTTKAYKMQLLYEEMRN